MLHVLLEDAISTGISHIFGRVEGRRESTECGGFIPINWQTLNQCAGQDGSTALHNAALMCSEDIVKLLVQNKADANIQNQVSLVKICRDLKAHCVVFT